jgi:glycosyltransferase involved in cell wall biosynthesis
VRIVLDLQGAQASNRARGIGRYTLALAQAIVRHAGKHEVLLALNGTLEDGIESLRAAFAGLLPEDSIRVWRGLKAVSGHDVANSWRRQASEKLREAFLSSLRPDVVHIGSLFEGFGDDAVTGIGTFTTALATSMTLYDLIPLIHRETYLRSPAAEGWYENKLDHLRRAHLWLAISEASRRDAVHLLGLPDEAVVTIPGAADERFRPVRLAPAEAAALRARLGLKRPFVMYTGGIDHRKNVEGLIRSYALLPADVRNMHQLAIVCAAPPSAVQRLREVATQAGLAQEEVVLTSYVSDSDLVALYSLCALFVFPSLYEGFGLPLLEAMSCGAPAIAADNSSLPEIVGDKDALFDGSSATATAAAIHRSLTDAAYRQHLKWNASCRRNEFSWELSAKRAIAAFESLHARRQHRIQLAMPLRRPRLAYVAPLPPQRSGIADYSVDLLVGLTRHYDVDVVVDQPRVAAPRVTASCGLRDARWFDVNAHHYDRILYEFGNSHFHQHMFRLLERHPGVVSLHDFFLGSCLLHMERAAIEPHCWSRALYVSHGYHALVQRFADPADAVIRYPANRAVLENALGIITNSAFALRLAQHWYGAAATADWAVVPQVRCLEPEIDRADARKQLGMGEHDFVVCSFGILASTKLNHRLLDAWRSSPLGTDQTCHLVFVGDHYGSEYGQVLLRSIAKCPLPRNIRITGFTPLAEYRLWLAAADVAVQLRTQSRGETSRGALDCLARGLPTIVNAHGSMPELPVSRVLPDAFADHELASALEELRNNPGLRAVLGRHARQAIAERHNPRTVAEQLSAAVENFYERARFGQLGIMAAVTRLPEKHATEEGWLELGEAIAQALPRLPPARQVLLDISRLEEWVQYATRREAYEGLRRLLQEPSIDARLEPVRHVGAKLCYARRCVLDILGLPIGVLEDEAAEVRRCDVYLDLFPTPTHGKEHDVLLAHLRSLGVRTYAFVDVLPRREAAKAAIKDFLVARYHGVVCAAASDAHVLLQHAAHVALPQGREFLVGCIDVDGRSQVGHLQAEDAFTGELAQWRRLVEIASDRAHSCWMRSEKTSTHQREKGGAAVDARERQWAAHP